MVSKAWQAYTLRARAMSINSQTDFDDASEIQIGRHRLTAYNFIDGLAKKLNGPSLNKWIYSEISSERGLLIGQKPHFY